VERAILVLTIFLFFFQKEKKFKNLKTKQLQHPIFSFLFPPSFPPNFPSSPSTHFLPTVNHHCSTRHRRPPRTTRHRRSPSSATIVLPVSAVFYFIIGMATFFHR
jgi:hypothetical protein